MFHADVVQAGSKDFTKGRMYRNARSSLVTSGQSPNFNCHRSFEILNQNLDFGINIFIGITDIYKQNNSNSIIILTLACLGFQGAS